MEFSRRYSNIPSNTRKTNINEVIPNRAKRNIRIHHIDEEIFSILHQSFRYIGHSVEQIERITTDYESIKILCFFLTESDEQLNCYHVKKFTMLSKYCRQRGEPGGVAIFINEGFLYLFIM